jgi:hypothetical protein
MGLPFKNVLFWCKSACLHMFGATYFASFDAEKSRCAISWLGRSVAVRLRELLKDGGMESAIISGELWTHAVCSRRPHNPFTNSVLLCSNFRRFAWQ